MTNPQQTAHYLIQRQVKGGMIPPASECRCQHCGAVARDYHHEDYASPLDVIPLCASCHRRLHAGVSQKTKMLFVRMKQGQRSELDALALDYGMKTPDFIRAALEYVNQERPALTRRIVPQRRPVATNGHTLQPTK